MSDVLISTLITIGTMVVGFVGNALYLRGSIGARLNNAEEDIRNIKDSVRYKDTCNATHKEVDHRLDRLEVATNGRLK